MKEQSDPTVMMMIVWIDINIVPNEGTISSNSNDDCMDRNISIAQLLHWYEHKSTFSI